MQFVSTKIHISYQFVNSKVLSLVKKRKLLLSSTNLRQKYRGDAVITGRIPCEKGVCPLYGQVTGRL